MKFRKKKLKNGITVLHEPRNLPIVSLSVTNKFGAGFEDAKIKGIAHVIEHLVFTGTKTRTHEDISREIEKKGGVLNAFTSHEATSFWFKLPSEHLFSGLEILSDMLNNPTFEKEKFEKEKRVILEEIKMYHDSPQQSVYEQIEKNLFHAPFGNLVIGSKETVSALQRDFVADYFEKAYSPENFIVTIVGDANLERICSFLETKFKKKKISLKLPEIKKKNAETIEYRKEIDQAHLVFAAHAPLPNSKENFTLKVLDAYLANGMSSKLFLEIREKRGLAYTVNSSIEAEKNYAFYAIYVGTTKPAVNEVKKLILLGFQDVKNMSEEDLAEAKTRLIGLRRVVSEESINVMNALMFAELNGDAKKHYLFEKNVLSVSLAEVKKLAEELIKHYSTAAILPK